MIIIKRNDFFFFSIQIVYILVHVCPSFNLPKKKGFFLIGFVVFYFCKKKKYTFVGSKKKPTWKYVPFVENLGRK